MERESDEDNDDGDVGQHPTYPEGSSSLVSDSDSAKGSVDVQRTEVCRGKERCRRKERRGAERVMAQEMDQGHVLSFHWTDRDGETEEL